MASATSVRSSSAGSRPQRSPTNASQLPRGTSSISGGQSGKQTPIAEKMLEKRRHALHDARVSHGFGLKALSARFAAFRVALSRHPIVEWMGEKRAAFRRMLRRGKPWCSRNVDSPSFQTVMFAVTVYALLGDDMRLAFTSAPADLYFNIVTIIAFFMFSFELVASCIGKDDYFLSFFFWLDLLATVSLILDITWVYKLFIGLGDTGGDKEKDTSVARAGRMSRVGTRAGRVIRVLRLIRLLRIVKLYKHVFDFANRWKGKKEEGAKPGGDVAEDEIYAESRVGQKLSQMTTQKVIMLILLMIFMLPLVSVEAFFRDLPTSSQYGADVVYRSYVQCKDNRTFYDWKAPFDENIACQNFEQQLTMYIGYHNRQKITGCDNGWAQAFKTACKLDLGWIGFREDTSSESKNFNGYEQKSVEEHWDHLFGNGPFVTKGSLTEDLAQKLSTGRVSLCSDYFDGYGIMSLHPSKSRCPSEMRLEESSPIIPRLVSMSHDPGLVFVFDLRPWVLRFAVFNILQTAFICCILAVGAMVFSHDANVLVLQPIERMIAKVEKIRDNPLHAMKLGDESYREMQEQEEDAPKSNADGERSSCCSFLCCRRKKETKVQTLETKILENAIIKLGKLLALGFGEAGSEIIGKNMDDDSATVNAMIPGHKVEAVFGFCDIRNFTDTTEVLQDKVMVFVNQVAEIVHNIVDTWHGAANRNIGDAFLIVWRMREEFDESMRTKVGDMSVISFVQVVAAINKSTVLKDYREHPALLARLPNYRVRLGFGLHYGWAIEGAIGSEFKIDASYLSPHVNMASRLEAVTRQYSVLILMSEPLAKLCSLKMAQYFRTIDHVTLKGGMSTPIRLHTIDLNAEGLAGDYILPKKGLNQFELRRQREKAKAEKFGKSFEVHELFQTDFDLIEMRQDFPLTFFQQFNVGYLNYEAGEWDVARRILERTASMLVEPRGPWKEPDGPSKALLDFMAEYDYQASKATPKGWLGYRELTES